ncbi:MAG: tRNA pseudouridine(55) synthase TruB [Synergistaceae bacterium]|jgi:tRNA pseudouridine(55) synthase|nr:tRNA pseudouridine(55) synthase TruB [Synergistaceae bacterium]
MFQGFISINKPVGLRSSTCVEKVKRILGNKTKVGHGGTLDSSAGGVLVMLLGASTRLSGYVMRMPKTYRAVLKLGSETTTCDYTGDVTAAGDTQNIRESDIDSVIPRFLGWRMQTPPDISAIHVKGRRAHEIRRSGGTPDLAARPVFIKSVRREGPISSEGELSLAINCGKGVYVRAIARDMGRMLGCRAHIASLTRLAIGPFALENALRVDEDFSVRGDDMASAVFPPESLGSYLPLYSAGESDASKLAQGRTVMFSGLRRETCGAYCPGETIIISRRNAMTVGTLGRTGGTTVVKPEINIDEMNGAAGAAS